MRLQIVLPLFLGIAVSALPGCGRMAVSPAAPQSSIRHETSRNYQLGLRKTVSVGDSIIRVRDYYVTRSAAQQMTPTQTFTFAPELNLSFVLGQAYQVAGSTERAGRIWTVVLHPRETNYAILVGENGEIHNEAFWSRTGFKGPLTIKPASARMMRVLGAETIEPSKPYTNYEIIYNGTDKNSILFTYREFSPEGLARAAFFQNLTYDARASTIRFKKFRIEVHSATSEGISYTVLEEDSGT